MHGVRRRLATLVTLCAALAPGAPALAVGADPSPYAGVGAGVDMFDPALWANPAATVRAMDRHGVDVLFLQTGSDTPGPPVFRPARTGRFLEAAHRRGMTVVGWYLAPLRDVGYERRRAL